MRNNLRLVVNNPYNKIEEKQFFEKDELKIILDLYARWFPKVLGKIMVSTYQASKLALVYLGMQQKMHSIKSVKILSQKIKI